MKDDSLPSKRSRHVSRAPRPGPRAPYPAAGLRPVTLVGDSVRLIPMQIEHAAALFDAGNRPEVWLYMPGRARTPEEMAALVEEAIRAAAAGMEAPFVIIDRSREQIVGSTRLIEVSRADRGLEIGWTWLSPDVWRTRINTECKYLLLQHAFETLGAYRVQLKTDGRNERSQRAIERIGAVKEGILRRHRILPDGYVRDSVYYSILDTEWPAIKERLEGLLSAPAAALSSDTRSQREDALAVKKRARPRPST